MKVRDFHESDLEGEWAEGVGANEIRHDILRMTVVDEETVVAIGGITLDRDVPLFWMQVKKGIKHTLTLMKMIKDGMNIILEQLSFIRAYALLRTGFEQGRRTLKLLGFKPTGESMEYDNIIYDWYEIWHSYPHY